MYIFHIFPVPINQAKLCFHSCINCCFILHALNVLSWRDGQPQFSLRCLASVHITTCFFVNDETCRQFCCCRLCMHICVLYFCTEIVSQGYFLIYTYQILTYGMILVGKSITVSTWYLTNFNFQECDSCQSYTTHNAYYSMLMPVDDQE